MVKRRLTITGTTSLCAKAVKVTVAKVGSRRKSALRTKLGAAKWSGTASLAKGRYRVTVTAVATTGGKAAAARSKTITVK